MVIKLCHGVKPMKSVEMGIKYVEEFISKHSHVSNRKGPQYLSKSD